MLVALRPDPLRDRARRPAESLGFSDVVAWAPSRPCSTTQPRRYLEVTTMSAPTRWGRLVM